MTNKQIDFAFLDSGTGGIPYMLYLKEKMPDCKCVYLGDTLNFPYGEKTIEEVKKLSAKTISLIIKKWNPKVLVIACNTISVTALEDLRQIFPKLSIVGTVPAIKLASKISKNKNIGLLATTATVNHPYCQKLIKDYAQDCNVFSRPDPKLISFIEHELFTSTKEDRLNAVKEAVDFFKSNNCDSIILACTHFCHLYDEFTEIAGKNISVVDSREGVVNQAIKLEALVKSTDEFENLENENLKDMTFFVTQCKTLEDEKEYSSMCEKFSIPWGGVL